MKTLNFAHSLGLKVTSAVVNEINPIILKTSVNTARFGNVVNDGGVPTIIDVANNTATPLTSASIAAATVDGLSAAKPNDFQMTAIEASEKCGTVTKLVFEKDTNGKIGCPQDIVKFAKANGYKVTDMEVAVQNDIIFNTIGIKSVDGLTKHEGKYFKLDVNNNTATVIDAKAISEAAIADVKAEKSTDMTAFVEQFGLVTKLELTKA